MVLLNNRQSWGWVSIALHWLIALTLFGLFGLGLWMTGLDYYDPWYRRAPDLHRSIGMLLLLAIAIRLMWRWLSPMPERLSDRVGWEPLLASISHSLLYLVPLALVASGYLISTADGRAVAVFNWFEIPAAYTGIEQQEEVMGDVHEILAWTLMGVTMVHAIGALKHHFIDGDRTLIRMLRPEFNSGHKGKQQ